MLRSSSHSGRGIRGSGWSGDAIDISDRWWRLENLYVIRDKERNLRLLKPNPGQSEIISVIKASLAENRPIRHMDLKARQVGASTLWLVYFLDDTLFTPNTVTFIVAQKQETLGLLWDAIRLAYESMPDALRPKAREDSARSLSFDGLHSTIKVSLKVEGSTLHNLHVSEYALCDPDSIGKTLAAAPTGANIALETAPSGMNHAQEKWVQVGDGYSRLFHPWFKQPEYRMHPAGPVGWTQQEREFAERTLRRYKVKIDDAQLLWRRFKMSELKRLFLEQFPEDEESCFLSTGGAYFDGAKIKVLLAEAKAHDRPLQSDKEQAIWERPQGRHVYAAGADVAEGVDGDYSVLAVLCVTCRKTAYRYRARCGYDYFYRLCDRIGREYNRALLAVERNNHGHAVIMGLRERAYPNLYYNQRQKRPLSGIKPDLKYGWETTKDTKPAMLDKLRFALEGNSEEDEDNFRPDLEWLDWEFLMEILYVREEGGKIGAVAGKHDDMVIAYAIAYQMYLRAGAQRTPLGGLLLGDKLESA